ncbi:MAG TPA: hypothetical protein VGF24_18250 [Vicinamibacterales bacterium]
MSSQPVQLDRFVFVAGRIESANRSAFVAHYLPALKDDVYVAVVLIFDSGEWRRVGKFGWQAVDIELDPSQKDRYWVLGRDGQLAAVAGDDTKESKLDDRRPLGPMRGLDAVDGDVYAVGMKRDVFRLRDGQWARFDKGMAFDISKGADVETLMKQRLGDVGGINAIVGFDQNETYAVGTKGEMWQGADGTWSKIETPTNVMLTDAAIVDDEVIACGLAGTLVRGRGTNWRVVEYDGVQDLDFAAIACRGKEVYLADGHSLRCLVGSTLEVVDLVQGTVVPSSQLDASQGLVLSVAGQEVFLGSTLNDWRSLL